MVKTGDTVAGKQLDFLYGLQQLTDQGEIVYIASWQGDAQGNYGVFSTKQGLIVSTGERLQGVKILSVGLAGVQQDGVAVLSGTYQPAIGVGDAIFTPTTWLLDTNQTLAGTIAGDSGDEGAGAGTDAAASVGDVSRA